MKRTITKISFIAIMLCVVMLAVNCKKDETTTPPNNNNPAVPVLTTTAITDITETTAKSGGNITSDGGATVTARGVCWSIGQTPTISDNKTIDGTGAGIFASNINNLLAGTTYYVRAYATNSKGTGYGSTMSFSTNTSSVTTVTDYDGNVYDTIHIGTQVWLKQNLKTTHYKNGTAITNVTDNTTWAALTTGAYCDYNNTPSFGATYGKLYNWYAVNTGNLCPTGWHIPSDAEWTKLTTYLGGETIAGGKLKATTLWPSPNTGATNETGFTALPGGNRTSNGECGYINFAGYWWSSTENNANEAYGRCITYDASNVYRFSDNKPYALSVRCIKD